MSLSVKHLFKRYGNKWVLKDISFDARCGEILGIFGPSGSGKTTLLKVLAGDEDSNGGTIHWQDRDITKLNRAGRNFSCVTRTNISGWRSIFRGKKTSKKNASERVNHALADAEDVLLLDDPFCGMDRNLREKLIEQIRQAVAANGLTVLLTTSRYGEIFEACDRVAVLVENEVKQVGSPLEVYDRPGTVAVAQIVGRNNIFGSRRLTSSKSDHPEFITLDGEHRLFGEKADVKTLGAINKNVSLAIRPENISISFGASFPEDNLLKAVVNDVKPRGASTLVQLDSNGLKLEALVLRLVGLNVGDECMIGLPPDRIQVLAE